MNKISEFNHLLSICALEHKNDEDGGYHATLKEIMKLWFKPEKENITADNHTYSYELTLLCRHAPAALFKSTHITYKACVYQIKEFIPHNNISKLRIKLVGTYDNSKIKSLDNTIATPRVKSV